MGSDPSKLFSFGDLLEQFRQFARYALVPGSILIHIKVAVADKMLDLDDLAENPLDAENFFGLSEEGENKFNEIARDMIVDLARFGYI